MKKYLAAGMALVLIFSIACDQSQGVTFVNDTAEAITLYEDGQISGMLKAHEQKTMSFGEHSGLKLFEARNAMDKLIYSEELTWQALRDRQWRIVIRELRP